ncbi:MAG TPA: hypothetical protein VEZ11_11720 [Thermoanaerobaculia bacterium]|nr:hypothetical protein [Thermoanaerobaculia bacterium]
MTRDESVTVKGLPVRSLQKFIDTDLTPDQRERAFSRLPAEYSARFSRPVLATETVPVHMLNVLTEEAAQAKGESLDSFARRAGREAAGDAIRGIYRFFAMVMTPPALLGKASQMWKSLYNQGLMTIEDQTGNSARIRILEFPSELAGCSRITGWIERMAELTGARNVKIEHTKCFTRNGEPCEWAVRWE